MAKCGDCSRPIDTRRGYCTFWVCHNKMIGGDRPDILETRKGRLRHRPDRKRCPFCTGERTGQGPCFISACNRGPGGKSCGCHFQMAGMGNPGQEMRAMVLQRQAKVLARHLGVESGGGARFIV